MSLVTSHRGWQASHFRCRSQARINSEGWQEVPPPATEIHPRGESPLVTVGDLNSEVCERPFTSLRP